MRRLWMTVLILVLIAALFSAPAGPAASAGSRTGSILEVGNSPNCVYHTIADALAAAQDGDTIKVENSTFVEEQLYTDKDITLAGGYNRTDYACLTQTGYGYTTLHTDGPYGPFFGAIWATVSIRWFIFEGNTYGGGGVSGSDSHLNLEHVIIRNNSAYRGGGLALFRSSASLIDCEITNNSATYVGGGIDVEDLEAPAALMLTRVLVQGNSAGANGGGIYSWNAPVALDDWVAIGGDSTTANHAAGNGGGVYLEGSRARLAVNDPDVTLNLIANTAGEHGGGLYAGDGAQAVLVGTPDPIFGELLLVLNNVADSDGSGTGSGGGMYATGGATIEARSMYAYGNQAQNGGAIALDGASLAGSDVRLQYNHAVNLGGGLYAAGGTASLDEGSEIGGVGEHLPNNAYSGGGVYATSGASVTLTGSAIRGNQALYIGSGAYLNEGAQMLATSGTVIDRNGSESGGWYGGGVYAEWGGARLVVDASEVVSNTATRLGGGLFIGNSAEAEVRNGSVVRGNTVGTPENYGAGGGAYVASNGARLSVDASTIRDNNAIGNGGGIWTCCGATVSLARNSLVVDNVGLGTGGGIGLEYATLNVVDSSIRSNNTTLGSGGGIHSLEGQVTLERSGLELNSAPLDSGGGLSAHDTALFIRRTRIAGNSSKYDGSGLDIHGPGGGSGPLAEVTNSFIVDNITLSSPIPGCCSAVYVDGARAMLKHNTIARQEQGGYGVRVNVGADLEMWNTIIANFSTGIRRVDGIDARSVAVSTLFYNNVTAYDPDVLVYQNFYGDPAFVGSGDYHVMAVSQAIDRGPYAGVGLDFDGQPRPMGDGFDLGADEYPGIMRIRLPLVTKGY